jgi:3-phenylpropionate/trans-cinnamate dioxygenase ferredoxin reductase component
VNGGRTVLVVGAGLAGARCAETLRAEGFDGEVVLVGDEVVPPYERPALSKELLAGTRTVESLWLRPEEFWGERRIEVVLGQRVVRVDPTERLAVTDRGGELRWDALVVATGARPRRLPFETPAGVHVLRTLADALSLREELGRARRLAVVGGGFVGAEVASTARGLGLEVAMLEAAETPFAKVLRPELGSLLARRYRAHGVELRTSVLARGFRTDRSGRICAVELADGSAVACDVALVAVGVEPVREPSVAVPEVELAGDAAGGPGHWTSAAADGVAAARRVLGLEPLPSPQPFFWSDQFGLRIQLVGDTRAAEAVEIEGDESELVARYLARDRRLVAALAVNRPAEVGALRNELALAA